jgi:hypothetical protein
MEVAIALKSRVRFFLPFSTMTVAICDSSRADFGVSAQLVAALAKPLRKEKRISSFKEQKLSLSGSVREKEPLR